MAQSRLVAPMLVSPTPIRPISPAGSPIRESQSVNEKQWDYHSKDKMCEDEELGQEILEIFQGSPRSSTVYSNCNAYVDTLPIVKPPSRNQNPLIKDSMFDNCHINDRDVYMSSLSAAVYSDWTSNN
mmetsp:Transcript_7234/g.16563  ORF Transcript_7234/g.16563 Transcript_7234/m.16563 type:complete len:127 (-) Transcript_7234:259-639(-)